MMDCSRLLNCSCSILIKNLNNKVPRVWVFTKGEKKNFPAQSADECYPD